MRLTVRPVELLDTAIPAATRRHKTAGTPASAPPLLPIAPARTSKTTPIRMSGLANSPLTTRVPADAFDPGAGRLGRGVAVGFQAAFPLKDAEHFGQLIAASPTSAEQLGQLGIGLSVRPNA